LGNGRAAKEQRVVGQHQLGALVDGLVDDVLDRVDGQQDAVHEGVRVSADQARAVPVLRPRRGVQLVEDGDDLRQRRGAHVREGSGVGPAGFEPTTAAV
jgi:hypothetical protein